MKFIFGDEYSEDPTEFGDDKVNAQVCNFQEDQKICFIRIKSNYNNQYTQIQFLDINEATLCKMGCNQYEDELGDVENIVRVTPQQGLCGVKADINNGKIAFKFFNCPF